MIKGNKTFILIVLLAFLLFLAKSYFSLDPDFGWHLKMGELILKSGIPHSDPFSYSMPSYRFVDHEWLSDLIIYQLYSRAGIIPLALLFAVLPIISVLVPVRLSKSKKLLFILSCGTIISFVGIRPQLITLFFFSLLTVVVTKKSNYQRFRLWIPFLFFLWANLHGGFATGIASLALFVVVRSYQAKKAIFQDFLVLFASIMATILNPYGLGLWGEIWNTLSDSSLRWTILEWTPSLLWFVPQMWLYILLSALLIIKYPRRFSLFEKLFYAGLLLAGLTSIRNMAVWSIGAISIASSGLDSLRTEANKEAGGKKRFSRAYLFLSVLSIIFIIVMLFPASNSSFYPDKAVSYLKKNTSKGQLFSEHGWGGYLIWKYPQKKVFIDGRMNSWRVKTFRQEESSYAYREFLDLKSGKISLDGFVKKYKIDTFLLYRERHLGGLELQIAEIDTYLSSRISGPQKYNTVYDDLRKGGWKIVYEDEVSVIYRR